MATAKGWVINHNKSIPVTMAAAITEGQVLKLTGEGTADVCGAGDTPAGVAQRAFASGDNGEIVKGDIAVLYGAAAITVGALLMAAAAGTVTPVTANNDIIVGRALSTQATVGAQVSVDLALLGSYYGA